MSDAALLAVALVASIAGMALFALSISAHWGQLFDKRPHSRGLRIGLRVAGAVLFAVAFQLCALADPVSMAALVWPMLLTVAAAVVASFFTIQAALARRRSTGSAP